MHWQVLITVLLVAGCAGYASWNMMPASWRRRLAAFSGRPMAPAATAGCGGCDGCGGARPAAKGVAAEAGVSVIRIVRQPPAH